VATTTKPFPLRVDGPVVRVVLIRHAEPVARGESPPAERPLTEKGRNDAGVLGTKLAGRSAGKVVWTSPERRARETAELVFPLAVPRVRHQLGEVTKPWYASADELTDAAARYLKGEVVEGWELRKNVITRIDQLKSDFGSMESLVLVSHGMLLTTWLDHDIGLSDPLSFWSNLQMPDAWELNLDDKSLERFA